MGGIPAGWHIDPDDSTLLRYWDGEQWTEHRQERPAGTATAPASAPPRSRMGAPGSTPGWYPDHERPGWVRYWDGQGWTDSTQREGRVVPPQKQPWYGGPLRLILLGVLGILVIAALATSGGDDSTAERDSVVTGPSRYTQTWPKNYSETTCAEWFGSMSPEQRFAAAADMLTGAQATDGGTDLPPDSLIESFRIDVTEACQPDASITLATVGASIYLIGRSTYMP